MKHIRIAAVVAVLCVGGLAWADDDGGRKSFKADLDGYQEFPAVFSTGTGEFEARIVGNTIEYELSYENLEGATTTQAHVHFGKRSDSGGVSFFLCGGGDKPPCPPDSGTVTGVVDPTDIIGPTNQGIAPGEFEEIVRAMRDGVTYANVHTDKHPGGEIRGQIKGRGRGNDD